MRLIKEDMFEGYREPCGNTKPDLVFPYIEYIYNRYPYSINLWVHGIQKYAIKHEGLVRELYRSIDEDIGRPLKKVQRGR